MKKSIFALPVLAMVLLFSCSKESSLEDQLQSGSSEELKSTSLISSSNCDNDLIGPTVLSVGSTVTFTCVANAPDPNPSSIVWTVPTGLRIISGQGTATLRVSVGSAFNGGQISVDLNQGQCGKSMGLSRAGGGSVTCPSRSNLFIAAAAGANGCDDFGISLNNANDVASVSWTYSIQSINNRSFGTSSNPNGNYSIFKPLYLPTGSYNNHYLWVTANITLTDGSTCTVSNSKLLSCSGSGGGGNP
ncbi:hypothetical protein WIW50_00815 [Flavobacteriaceae bacterium 3-367]|uniref:hypothetical protein n=1 Tax=Eudoraea algarum TaxID=3417568 RepID=UPI003292082F